MALLRLVCLEYQGQGFSGGTSSFLVPVQRHHEKEFLGLRI